MDDRIETALGRAFPGRDVDSVAPAGISWNEKNTTVRVEFADGEVVYLKVAHDHGVRIARESAVVAYVGAHTDVPVPTILSSEADAPVPYLATAPVTGQILVEPWGNATESARESLASETGAALARVHALRFDDHGLITGGDASQLELETGSWTDVLVETIDHTRALATTDRFDHYFDEVVAAVEENRRLLDDAPAALVHGDLAQPNCFRVGDRIGFLDWEIAHVGDPVRDLYRAKKQQFNVFRTDPPERGVEALFEGYRSVAGGLPEGYADRRPIYEAVWFLIVPGFFDKFVEDYDEDPEELAAWMADEMSRLLDRITS
ncbi:phosphotransferase family protein [Haloferax larsenii]|uniref:Predicted kinase, aminoglycoside phosphotransferase (APT) family n=1 Tax=Haloferax larsenii TaxID=302484 RepID=A0A1H7IY09_HALLR|nr:phosphotransferase [Haloferax larsenii]SEK67266.1 Predicted kinase, aminoglycoside phosphotransferase (APT) family [Haloferax larsenii]